MTIKDIKFSSAMVFKKYTKLVADYTFNGQPVHYVCKEHKHKQWTPRLKQEAYYAMLRAIKQYEESL